MAEKSLGYITPGAGRVRATANEDTPALPVYACSYRVQHVPGNTGRGIVGDSEVEFGTGAGVFGFLPAPTEAEPWPMYESPNEQAGPLSNPFNMADVYFQAENGTDTFLVSYMQA
jgi:hypothetical protein